VLGSNCTFAWDGTSAAGSTSVIYNGSYLGNTYIIRTGWQGSKNGIEDVKNATPNLKLWDKSTTGSVSPGLSANATYAPSSAETALEIGFSDCYAPTFGLTATTYDKKVGVLPFRWYVNNGTSGIDNITSAAVQKLYSANNAKKSLLTGLASDNSTLVYAVGRDSDSGTRFISMAESGRGNKATPQMRSVTISNNSITTTPASSHTGYSSGSSVKNALNATCTVGAIVGYVGASDVPTSGVLLKWNGVTYSDDNIKNGSYTMWSYLHMNYETLSTEAQAFADALETALLANPGTGVLKESDMAVTRSADAGVISSK
jgi:hypothetical protein